MKVGDLVRIVRYHYGNIQSHDTGLIIKHSHVSEGGYDVWSVFVNRTGERHLYNSEELRIINE
jgi:hypothetical protein